MVDLQELEAIKRLKYKYFRCIDEKLWDEMRSCFIEDATCSYIVEASTLSRDGTRS